MKNPETLNQKPPKKAPKAMIIDLILERRDGEEYSREMLETIREHAERFCYCDIAVAIDTKDETAMKEALCAYIDGEYNPDIKAYVRSVAWVSTKKPTIRERMESLEAEYIALRNFHEFAHADEESNERKLERMGEINEEFTRLARRNPKFINRLMFYKKSRGNVLKAARYYAEATESIHSNGVPLIEYPYVEIRNFDSRTRCTEEVCVI